MKKLSAILKGIVDLRDHYPFGASGPFAFVMHKIY